MQNPVPLHSIDIHTDWLYQEIDGGLIQAGHTEKIPVLVLLLDQLRDLGVNPLISHRHKERLRNNAAVSSATKLTFCICSPPPGNGGKRFLDFGLVQSTSLHGPK